MRRLGWLFVGFALLLAVPAGAEAKAGNACRSASKADGVEVMARNSTGVVFRRKSLNIFGCTYKKAKVRRLHAPYTDITFKIAGHYAAYTAQGSAIGDESSKVGVFDLLTGKLRVGDIETDGFVKALALSKSGGIAWIQDNLHPQTSGEPGPGQYGPDQALRAATPSHRAPHVVDTGSTDNTGGGLARLRLRSGVLSWTNQGVAKTAKLS
jgi:hypothetical protein